MHHSLTHIVTAATTPLHPYAAAVNDSSSCGNDFRQEGNGWSESLFLGLISVFNPSISYRGVLTGSRHCGPAGLRLCVCMCVCASACECEHIVLHAADTGAESAVVHTYVRECKRLIYSTTWFIESAPSVRLQCSCSPACLPGSADSVVAACQDVLGVHALPPHTPPPQINTTT